MTRMVMGLIVVGLVAGCGGGIVSPTAPSAVQIARPVLPVTPIAGVDVVSGADNIVWGSPSSPPRGPYGCILCLPRHTWGD